MLNIRRILIPVDFSAYCSSALSYGRELARLHGADVDLVHVIEEPAFPAFYRIGEEALYGEVASLRERAQEAFGACMEEASGPEFEHDVGFHVEKGKPADKIIELAKEHDTDLIVISTHGMSGIERVLMGNVAERVVREAPCPVFVVKSFGKAIVSTDDA